MNLQAVFEAIEPEFSILKKELIETLKSEVALSDEIFTYVSERGGKRLRPILVILSAKVCGQTEGSTIKSAIAMELLHTATLIHDDVIDEAPTRRGSESVNKIWKNRLSVFVGDHMFAQTLKILNQLNNLEAISILAETAQIMTEGELLQIETKRKVDIPLEIYLKLIEAKTAALFMASCKLGVITSGNNTLEARNAIQNYAKNLGIAFQIKDDLLNFQGEFEKTGKPQGNDLLEGKLTLPMILALETCDKKERKEIISKVKKGIELNNLEYFINFINRYEGLEKSELMAQKFVEKGISSLDFFDDSKYKNALIELLQFTVSREN
ncbi:MAG: polyprenyl synthetase family protein [Calditrichaeota bacterium]|nr:MAG: polyprenyl synthetase family protein [Calditrichota bacterium]